MKHSTHYEISHRTHSRVLGRLASVASNVYSTSRPLPRANDVGFGLLRVIKIDMNDWGVILGLVAISMSIWPSVKDAAVQQKNFFWFAGGTIFIVGSGLFILAQLLKHLRWI